MKRQLTIQQCREVLGLLSERMTDAEIEQIRDEYERVAEVLFVLMVEEGLDGLEGARWDSHFRLTGECE